MNACEEWRLAMLEHALGAEPSPSLATHFQQCAACAAAFREMQERLAAIDNGVRQIVAAEPDTEAPEQILAHIHSAADAGTPQVQRNYARVVGAALAGAAILAMSAAVVYHRRVNQAQEAASFSAAASISNWRSPTQELLNSPHDGWRAASPRLGQSFYPLETVPTSAQRRQVPRKGDNTR